MNKKIILALLIAVNVIIYVSVVSRFGIRIKKPDVRATPESTVLQVPPAHVRKTLPAPATLNINPFRSYKRAEVAIIKAEKTPVSTVKIEPDITLKGILYDEKNPSAIVEDILSGSSMILKTGASYKKSTIIEINKNYIIITTEGKKFKLMQDRYEDAE